MEIPSILDKTPSAVAVLGSKSKVWTAEALRLAYKMARRDVAALQHGKEKQFNVRIGQKLNQFGCFFSW